MDYGCGKGELVKLLQENYPFIKVCGYDPAVEEFENLPNEKFDFVIVTDVLEHIPENELPDTLGKISALSDKVFFHLHHAKAFQILPNGENAHCTIYSPEQYFELLSKFFSTLNFLPGLSSWNTSCVTFPVPKSLVEEWQFLLNPNEMQYVESLAEIIDLIKAFHEVIIFPADYEGNVLLDFFKYTDIENRISCIAVEKMPFEPVQFTGSEIPVMPIENLIHFRKTALFIVTGSEQNFGAADEVLRRYGCLKVVFATNEVYAQAQGYIAKLLDSGQVLLRYMRLFDEKLNKLEMRIDEQNVVRISNTKAFAEYRNAFRGKKIVIVGSGPTVKYYEPIPDAIHIALNHAWLREDIKFDFLFSSDVNAESKSMKIPVSKGFDKIREKIFIAKRVAGHSESVLNYPESIIFKSDKIFFYYVSKAGIDIRVHTDICLHSVMTIGSVVFSALQFALFTCPSEIYLVACDTTENGYFYDGIKDEPQFLNIRDVKLGYVRMKMFARQYYPETKIISINPVGLRGLFQDEYTGTYQKNLREQMTNW